MAEVAITKADLEELKESLMFYIDGRIGGVEKRLDSLEQTVSEIKTEVRVNAARIDSMNWSLATLAIVVGIVGFAITLAPMFREIYKDRKNYRTDDDVRAMIREEFTKLKSSVG